MTSTLNIVCDGTPIAVRNGLQTTMDHVSNWPFSSEQLGTVQVVLAEVMNNIVEHAYAETGHGTIELHVATDGNGIDVKVFDDGRPMPGGQLPAGRPAKTDVDLEDLPEGGFGWFLIHSLTEGIAYARDDDRNSLSFRIPLAAAV